jgi:hypothetical protein
MRSIAVVVYKPGFPGVPVEGADVIIDKGGLPLVVQTNRDGYVLAIVTNGLPLWINVVAAGQPRYELHTDGIDHGDGKHTVVIPTTTGGYELIVGDQNRPLQPNQVQCPPLTATLAPWSTNGYDFIVGGKRTLWKNYTFFSAHRMMLDGTLTDQAIRQAADFGANRLRVFTNWGNVNFDPATYGARGYTILKDLANRVAQFGLGLELDLVLPKPLAPSVSTAQGQINHANRVYEAINGLTNVVIAKINCAESQNDTRHIPPPPAGILWASGSSSELGTHVTFAGARFGHHIVNDCCSTEESLLRSRPCMNNEPTRPDSFGYDTRTAERMGRASAVWAGGCFHSGFQEGQTCQVLTGGAEACARAFFGGLQ